jgi:hypothetical protein
LAYEVLATLSRRAQLRRWYGFREIVDACAQISVPEDGRHTNACLEGYGSLGDSDGDAKVSRMRSVAVLKPLDRALDRASGTLPALMPTVHNSLPPAH